MMSKADRRVAAALVAAMVMAVAAVGAKESGRARLAAAETVRYHASCTAVDAVTVEGFVTNQGSWPIQMSGPVSFSFTVADITSHPTIQVQSSGLVPPGRTVSVARARLVWSLLPNEVCTLDVAGAVR